MLGAIQLYTFGVDLPSGRVPYTRVEIVHDFEAFQLQRHGFVRNAQATVRQS